MLTIGSRGSQLALWQAHWVRGRLEELGQEVLLRRFEARIENAAEFALTRRVVLLRAKSGVGVDIALGGLPFEESAVSRPRIFAFPVDALASHLLG